MVLQLQCPERTFLTWITAGHLHRTYRMQDTANKFKISYNLALIQVERLYDRPGEMYKIEFSNEVPPLTIMCTYNSGGSCKWSSVPPGVNEETAEGIGKLIENHFRNH